MRGGGDEAMRGGGDEAMRGGGDKQCGKCDGGVDRE